MASSLTLQQLHEAVQDVARHDAESSVYQPMSIEEAIFAYGLDDLTDTARTLAIRMLWLKALLLYRLYMYANAPRLLQPLCPTEGIDFEEYGRSVAELDIALGRNSAVPDIVCGPSPDWTEDKSLRACYLRFVKAYRSHFREHAPKVDGHTVQAKTEMLPSKAPEKVE